MAEHVYNPNYYDGVNMKQMRPAGTVAFKTYVLKDGTLIGLFQGSRGARPDIDFVVKMLIPGAERRPVPFTHTYWVVDLLLKVPQYRAEVREIVQYYLDFYDKTIPFSSAAERDAYELETLAHITHKYSHLEQDYTLSLDYVATVVELFCKNEKLTPGAYWFRTLLATLLEYVEGGKHFTDVLQKAQPGFTA